MYQNKDILNHKKISPQLKGALNENIKANSLQKLEVSDFPIMNQGTTYHLVLNTAEEEWKVLNVNLLKSSWKTTNQPVLFPY